MKKLLLLLLAVSATSCGGYIDSINAYRNSPAGQLELERQFKLDSIRAANTPFPFEYGWNYYNTRWNRGVFVYPSYYNNYRVRPSRTTRTVIIRGNQPRRNRTTVTRTPRTRPHSPAPRSGGRRGNQ